MKLVHFVAHCSDCDWETDCYPGGLAEARAHARKHRHMVTAESGYFHRIDGRLPLRGGHQGSIPTDGDPSVVHVFSSAPDSPYHQSGLDAWREGTGPGREWVASAEGLVEIHPIPTPPAVESAGIRR